MNIKKKVGFKPLLIISLTFLIIGVVFLVCSYFINLSNNNYIKNGTKVDATIVDIYDGYEESTVIVKYYVDGKEYVGELNYYSSSMNEGDIIFIYYMNDNPYDFTYADFSLLLFIFLIIGGNFVLSGVVIFIIYYSKIIKKRNLMEKGSLIHAQIISIKINTKVYVNGSNPVNIVCSDSYGNEFKANFINYYDLTYKEGEYIDVYVNPLNYKKYYVDIEKYIEDKKTIEVNYE